METTNLYFALVLSEVRNVELTKKIKGFENLTETLSAEVDRQRVEIESVKRKGKVLKFNHLRKVA
jgi:hypothetical protein